MPSAAKICVLCKQDCAGKPRVKDPAGRYFCKPCHEAAQTHIGKHAAAAVTAPAAQSDDLAWNTDDLASLQPVESAEPTFATCSSCNSPMARAAIICTHCGYNKATGQKPKPAKVAADPSSSLLKSETVATLWFDNPLVWFGAALIGAALGSALWITVMVSTGYELSLIGTALGASTGFAVALVARHRMTWGTGAMAAAVALAAVVGSRYYGIKMIADKEIDKLVAKIHVTPDQAKLEYEIDTTRQWMQQGKTLKWPSEDHPTLQDLDDVDDAQVLPAEAVLAADTQWTNQSDQWREDYRSSVEAKFKTAAADLGHQFAEDYAKKELTTLHAPDHPTGGYSIRGRGIGLIIGYLWPYAMPVLAAFFAFKCASGDWIEYDKPE